MGTAQIDSDKVSYPSWGQFKRGTELVVPSPSVPGVYVLLSEAGWPVYIGQSKDVARRVSQHIHSGKAFAEWRYYECDDESERLQLEAVLILTFRPAENAMVCLRVTPARLAEAPYEGIWRRRSKRSGKRKAK